MATNVAIVNHLHLLDPLCGNIMVFRIKTVQQTNLKLSANFAQQLSSIMCRRGSTSSMSAHLKRQHGIDEKSEMLDTKTVKTSPGTKNSTGTGQLKLQDHEDVMKNTLPRSGSRATAVMKSIGVFIAKDMRSYSVV